MCVIQQKVTDGPHQQDRPKKSAAQRGAKNGATSGPPTVSDGDVSIERDAGINPPLGPATHQHVHDH